MSRQNSNPSLSQISGAMFQRVTGTNPQRAQIDQMKRNHQVLQKTVSKLNPRRM